MKKHILLLLHLFVSCASVLACGNEYEERTSLSGHYHGEYEVGSKDFYLVHGFDTSALLNRKKDLEHQFSVDHSFKHQSDLALIELKIGDKLKAVQILEQLYREHPKEYNIAANLGTGYELIGENQKAYDILNKAIKLNPESHQGSEWIHLKILEAKIQHKDPSSIMQLNTDNALIDFYKKLSEDEIHHYNEIKSQLSYQLDERIAFVGPEDKIVGRLLIDLSDLTAITESVEQAIPYLDRALEYDPSLKSLVDSRLTEINSARRLNFIKKHWLTAVYILSLIGIAAFLIYRWRKLTR